MRSGLTPSCTFDDIIISIGLELAQAYIFSYFTDFNSEAVGFFGWVFVTKTVSDVIIWTLEPKVTEDKFEGCAAFWSNFFAAAPVFIVQTLSVATLQAVWIVLDVELAQQLV